MLERKLNYELQSLFAQKKNISLQQFDLCIL